MQTLEMMNLLKYMNEKKFKSLASQNIFNYGVKVPKIRD